MGGVSYRVKMVTLLAFPHRVTGMGRLNEVTSARLSAACPAVRYWQSLLVLVVTVLVSGKRDEHIAGLSLPMLLVSDFSYPRTPLSHLLVSTTARKFLPLTGMENNRKSIWGETRHR